MGQIEFQTFLESTPDLYAIISLDTKIVAASDAYCKATMVKREDMLGRSIFDVFPTNPNDHNSEGVKLAQDSIMRVIQNKLPDVMAVQKHDIRRPLNEGGDYEVRYWSPINSPILDENNNVAYIIHRVEDVTPFMKLKEHEGSQEKPDTFKNHVDKIAIETYKRSRQLQETNKKLFVINAELSATKARLTETNTTLKLNQKRFQLIVESTKDYAIFMLDPQGYITTWNAGAETIIGYNESEIIGKHFSIFYPKETLPKNESEKELNHAKLHGHYEVQGWRLRKSGERYWANIVNTALREEDGTLVGFSKIIRDMTEVKKSEMMKSEFISVVSHELRTPITSIQGSLDLLLGGILGEFSDKVTQLLKMTYKNCERLRFLVNDLLDIEKIESGLLHMFLEKINLIDLIQEVIEANNAYAKRFKASISFMKPCDEIFVYVDPDRLSQVITNLLSNAIKFSPEQSEVKIALELQANNTKVRVKVIDQGPGIDDEFKKRIFQKFSQADSSSKRKHGGTGLGLSISKGLMEKLGSKLEFTTELGKGSCFYFDLPIVRK